MNDCTMSPCIGDLVKTDSKALEQCKQQYFKPAPITGAKLAHAYVPIQFLQCLYEPAAGLMQGTIFPELDRPYGEDPEYLCDRE